jgi:hypothetical protein
MSNLSKAKVLRVYPEAYCIYNHTKRAYIVLDKFGSIDNCTIIGRGYTVDNAWQNAAIELVNNLNQNEKK